MPGIGDQLRAESVITMLRNTQIFEEIRAAGYDGGYTQVKEYLRLVRPRASIEPVVRFETPPGHQAQVDFASFQLPWGRRSALLVLARQSSSAETKRR